jgi:hypothetical protein
VLHLPSRSSGFWGLLIRAHVLQSPDKHWYILTGTYGFKLSWNTAICHVPKLGYCRKLLNRLLGGLHKSIITIKRIRDSRSGVRILAGRRFFFSKSPTGSESHRINRVPGYLIRDRRPGRHFDLLFPSSAEVKTKWSCTSTPTMPLWHVRRQFYPSHPGSFHEQILEISVAFHSRR